MEGAFRIMTPEEVQKQMDMNAFKDIAQIATELLETRSIAYERWELLHCIIKDYVIDIPNWEVGYFTEDTNIVIDLLMKLSKIINDLRPGGFSK